MGFLVLKYLVGTINYSLFCHDADLSHSIQNLKSYSIAALLTDNQHDDRKKAQDDVARQLVDYRDNCMVPK